MTRDVMKGLNLMPENGEQTKEGYCTVVSPFPLGPNGMGCLMT